MEASRIMAHRYFFFMSKTNLYKKTEVKMCVLHYVRLFRHIFKDVRERSVLASPKVRGLHDPSTDIRRPWVVWLSGL